jgi:hypothetical protein
MQYTASREGGSVERCSPHHLWDFLRGPQYSKIAGRAELLGSCICLWHGTWTRVQLFLYLRILLPDNVNLPGREGHWIKSGTRTALNNCKPLIEEKHPRPFIFCDILSSCFPLFSPWHKAHRSSGHYFAHWNTGKQCKWDFHELQRALHKYVRFEALIAMIKKTIIFWDVTARSMVEFYRHMEECKASIFSVGE